MIVFRSDVDVACNVARIMSVLSADEVKIVRWSHLKSFT